MNNISERFKLSNLKEEGRPRMIRVKNDMKI